MDCRVLDTTWTCESDWLSHRTNQSVSRTLDAFGDRAFAAAGTVYHHISEMLTYCIVGSGGH